MFLVTPGRIEEIPGLIGEPTIPASCCASRFRSRAARGAEGRARTPPAPSGSGIATHHLFSGKSATACSCGWMTLDEKASPRPTATCLSSQSPQEVEGEGVMKDCSHSDLPSDNNYAGSAERRLPPRTGRGSRRAARGGENR